MKTDYKILTFNIVIFSAFMIMIFNIKPNSDESKNVPNNFDEVEVYMDSLFDVGETQSKLTPTKFNYVYNRFKVFNPDLDSSTVVTFNDVCDFYNLDNTEEMLELCVGQILLESGAKQYYETNHPKEGSLVESYAGAIGFSQIMPATAYDNIKNYMSEEAIDNMYSLGCTSVAHIVGSTSTKSENIDITREWLTNETNNIILWGYIMRSKLDKRPDMLKVLVSYNAGTTGMINYVNGGGILDDHKYVIGIHVTLNYAEVRLS